MEGGRSVPNTSSRATDRVRPMSDLESLDRKQHPTPRKGWMSLEGDGWSLRYGSESEVSRSSAPFASGSETPSAVIVARLCPQSNFDHPSTGLELTLDRPPRHRLKQSLWASMFHGAESEPDSSARLSRAL